MTSHVPANVLDAWEFLTIARQREREREIYNEIVGREVGLGREREKENGERTRARNGGGGGGGYRYSCFRRTVGKRRISADGRKFGVMHGEK